MHRPGIFCRKVEPSCGGIQLWPSGEPRVEDGLNLTEVGYNFSFQRSVAAAGMLAGSAVKVFPASGNSWFGTG